MVQHVKRNWFIYLLLIAVTLIVYSRVVDFQLVHYDDSTYVMDNPHILRCINLESVRWAMSGKYEANWMPLTWISYMLDYQGYARSWPCYAADSAAHIYHRTNLILHVMNTLLLFVLLSLSTGSRWKSALAAAVFSVHPLHVESVAWVAERKDVLSTFFLMLTLLAYLSYTRKPGVLRYSVATVTFVLGLMSKSMLVTVPVLLLLLDFWPLRRAAYMKNGASSGSPIGKLLIEKLPLFAVSLAVGVITIVVQERGEAMRSLATYPMGERLANAVVSYWVYIGKTFWPVNLACFYPHPHDTIPTWQVVISAVALVLATAAAVRLAKRLPQVTVGWLWYLVMLLPVIGIIQVGAQAMADRYSYVPMIGLSVALIWGAAALTPRSGGRTAVFGALSCLMVACLMVRAYSQVGVWKDDIVLFAHAVGVTHGNSQMHFNLANSYLNQGDEDLAAEHFEAAIRINPADGESHNNLAMILLQRAERTGADDPDAYVFQGARFSRKDIRKAGAHFGAAAKLMPGGAGPHRYLACVLMIQGRLDEAIAEFRASLAIGPDTSTQEALREAILAKQASREGK